MSSLLCQPFGMWEDPRKRVDEHEISSIRGEERPSGRPMISDQDEKAEVLRSIVELEYDGILVFDEHHQIEFANPMASEMTGWSNTELLKMSALSLFDESGHPFLKDIFLHPSFDGKKVRKEVQLLTSEGGTRDVEVRVALLQSSLGVRRVYVYIRDISEQKKFEIKMKHSEDKLWAFFQGVKQGLFVSSREGKFLDCDQALLDMLGYPTKEEFLDIDIVGDLYANPEDRKFFQERLEKYGYAKDMEVELKKRDGERVTALLTGHPIKDEKGETVNYQGFILDISERKRIENELRESNEFFMNLIESSLDGIIAADMKGNIFIFNKGAETLTGYTAEEVIGKIHITKIYPEGIAKEVMKKLRSPEWGGVGKLIPSQFNVVNKEGEGIPIQLSASLIYDTSGTQVASVGIFTDLRPRIHMERKLQETHLQLVSSEKMASLGKLAAGIAHEINNPLGGIMIYSSLLMEGLPEDDPKRGDLARIVQEAGRCKQIVKSLLEFARQTEPRMEPTDINRAIMEGLFFLENQALFHNIRIVKNLDPALPYAMANGSQMKQVFMNIIVNAAEAMHGTGDLTITTYLAPDQNTIVMEFTDTGEGILEENLTRIFDPFFTTKDIGMGTGLGLATSYGIVKEHGGKISVRSKVGEGTSFTIELPTYSETQPLLEGMPPL